MAAEQGKPRKRKETKPPTFKYFIRINGAEPVDLFSIPEPRRQELISDLCDRFMAAFGYVPMTEDEFMEKFGYLPAKEE